MKKAEQGLRDQFPNIQVKSKLLSSLTQMNKYLQIEKNFLPIFNEHDIAIMVPAIEITYEGFINS